MEAAHASSTRRRAGLLQSSRGASSLATRYRPRRHSWRGSQRRDFASTALASTRASSASRTRAGSPVRREDVLDREVEQAKATPAGRRGSPCRASARGTVGADRPSRGLAPRAEQDVAGDDSALVGQPVDDLGDPRGLERADPPAGRGRGPRSRSRRSHAGAQRSLGAPRRPRHGAEPGAAACMLQ